MADTRIRKITVTNKIGFSCDKPLLTEIACDTLCPIASFPWSNCAHSSHWSKRIFRSTSNHSSFLWAIWRPDHISLCQYQKWWRAPLSRLSNEGTTTSFKKTCILQIPVFGADPRNRNGPRNLSSILGLRTRSRLQVWRATQWVQARSSMSTSSSCCHWVVHPTQQSGVSWRCSFQ